MAAAYTEPSPNLYARVLLLSGCNGPFVQAPKIFSQIRLLKSLARPPQMWWGHSRYPLPAYNTITSVVEHAITFRLACVLVHALKHVFRSWCVQASPPGLSISLPAGSRVERSCGSWPPMGRPCINLLPKESDPLRDLVRVIPCLRFS